MRKASILINFFVLLGIALALNACTSKNLEDELAKVEEIKADDPDSNDTEGGAACNTVSVSYSTMVTPIMAKSCSFSGCHSTADQAAGIVLDVHGGVVQSVNSGRFLGSIRHDPGFSRMPRGRAKLADCEIKQIEAWVEQGSQNN